MSTNSPSIQRVKAAAASAHISDIELAERALTMKVAIAGEPQSSQACATNRNSDLLSIVKEQPAFIASLVREVVGTRMELTNVHARLAAIEAAVRTALSQQSETAESAPRVSSISDHEPPTDAPIKRRTKSQSTSPSTAWFEFWTTEPRIWLMSGSANRQRTFELRAMV